jgi:uncharacterized protein YqeY
MGEETGMTLKEQLLDDMKKAMKDGDKTKLSTIRMIRTAVLNAEKEKKDEVSDAEVIDILVSSIKQRKEAMKAFESGGRSDLYEKEKAELDVLSSYLPEQISEDEIKKRVVEVIEETGASSMKDMGAVMKVLMTEMKGKAEGSLVNRIVKEALS